MEQVGHATRQWGAVRAAAALLALLVSPSAAPTAPRACATNSLCVCRQDHFACSNVPFYRFPETDEHVQHVSLSAARLGVLGEAALDARSLRTLVLVASRLHHLDSGALASMTATLASLDLGYNEFTEVPIEALRELKVLNWLSLQNNYISDLHPEMDWGFLADSLSSLSLSNNQLCVLPEGALLALRQLTQLDLDGNRLQMIAPGSLPPSLSLLRVADNLLSSLPCDTLAILPRLRHLHLRNNILHSSPNQTCLRSKIDFLDLSHNELDDRSELDFKSKLQLKQLLLDLNDFTTVPALVLKSGRLERLSISFNRLSLLSNAAVHALRRDLERLDLDHNDLIALPANLRDLTRLRHLSLSYNRLEEVLDLPPRLRYLCLAGNFFVSFPIALQSLAPATLGYLDLGYNRIAHLHASEFGLWASALATLSLRGNRLSQLASDAFPALPLRELILSYNDLYYVERDALANLTALQALELSSSLLSGEFPVAAPADSLSWLSLDNNNIHYISAAYLQNFPGLEYLNLDFNKIVEFPSEMSVANCSCKLRELRLAYNYVSKINADFFYGLIELQSVDLSYNRMNNVTERTFANLSNIVYISLVGNVIDYVADGAFRHLPKLEVLDLQMNSLVEFSTAFFENVSNEDTNFSVNASHNRITSLTGGPTTSINILDLSHNLLESLTQSFFDSLGPYILQLVLAHNRLSQIDGFGSGLPHLEVLSLQYNNISAVRRRALADAPALQILDLSFNRLASLAVEQFHALRRLRHLRLAGNELRGLPRDVLRNTVLEYLDLSENRFAVFPSSALAAVGFTLRQLELAGNRLEYLDVAMLHSTPFLHELGLSRNALTVLADNAFAGVARLRRLELSHNALKANFRELLHNVPRLRWLALADAGLRAAPPLVLQNLTELDLDGNHIAALREADVRRLTGLRSLRLARNRLTSLQPATWSALPRLTTLDVSHNPLVRITRGSFEGLGRLLHLRMEHLHRLEALEPRGFKPLVSLRSLSLDSLGANSLADVMASMPGLEALSVRMREEILDAQLIGLHAPKLRVLELSGAALKRVSPRAFTSLSRQRALALRLTRTGVAALPAGLARPLARVPHLALDLSDNRITSLAPSMLYPNLTGWNRLATKLLPGGLVVSGNPLRCGCGAQWMGAWLRRWAGEAGGGTRAALAAARSSTCVDTAARAQPLLALDADEAECHASALSSRAPASASHTRLPAFLWIVLLYSLS